MGKEDDFRTELGTYVVGLGVAVGLTALGFICVGWHLLPRSTLLWIIGVSAMLQIIVHFRCFLHIDLSKSKRDDLQLILFSTMIVILMVSGTIWITFNSITG